jgi:hypothetical protein
MIVSGAEMRCVDWLGPGDAVHSLAPDPAMP